MVPVLVLELVAVAVAPSWMLDGASVGVDAGGSCFSSITFWTLDGASIGASAGAGCR
jgi:hypothetical protein